LSPPPSTALDLAGLHLDTLYERDDAGLTLRERGGRTAAPDFHLVRTVDGNRWLLSAALSEGRRSELDDALSREPVVSALDEMEHSLPVVIARPLPEQGPEPVAAYRGPAFRFRDQLAPVAGPIELLRDPRGARVVPELDWIRDVEPAAHPLAVARNSSGEVVSICHSACGTARAAEAGAETALGYRGRGFAGAVVLAWAAALLAEGRLPLYSTQWSNHASRAVARKLGLIMYAEDYHCP